MNALEVSEAISILTQPSTLSIETLSAPILSTSPANTTTTTTRSSNVSTTSSTTSPQNPAALSADLAHHKDLFSKLRFSYVEQVTKERFLKSIVADSPTPISANDLIALETTLAQDKAALKQKKTQVATTIAELETVARDLARRHELVQLQTAQLESLPPQIEYLDTVIAELKAEAAVRTTSVSSDPEMRLSLGETIEVLEGRGAELAAVEQRIEELGAVLPQRKQEVLRAERELEPLQERKRAAIDEARDAQRKRGKGGDEIEKRGRWLRAQETVLRSVLEI